MWEILNGLRYCRRRFYLTKIKGWVEQAYCGDHSYAKSFPPIRTAEEKLVRGSLPKKNVTSAMDLPPPKSHKNSSISIPKEPLRSVSVPVVSNSTPIPIISPSTFSLVSSPASIFTQTESDPVLPPTGSDHLFCSSSASLPPTPPVTIRDEQWYFGTKIPPD